MQHLFLTVAGARWVGAAMRVMAKARMAATPDQCTRNIVVAIELRNGAQAILSRLFQAA